MSTKLEESKTTTTPRKNHEVRAETNIKKCHNNERVSSSRMIKMTQDCGRKPMKEQTKIQREAGKQKEKNQQETRALKGL